MIDITIPKVRHMLGAIKRQLLEQLRSALREKEGGSGLGDLLGPALARSCRRSWIHFNLREVIHLKKQISCVSSSAYLQINQTKINVLNINVLQINGSLRKQKFVEV